MNAALDSTFVHDDGQGGQVILTKQTWTALGWVNDVAFGVAGDGTVKWGWLDENIPNVRRHRRVHRESFASHAT